MSDPALPEVKHLRWDDIPVETVNPLFDRQLIVGDQIMVARVLLKKGCLVPTHSHFHEQISTVKSGVLQFTIDGREIVLREAEILCIPPHMPHSALALEDFVGIDIFTPPRADWLAKTDDYLRR
ncbi:MAG TPA: cupin domain-containing protein [Bryobacteraceae bacterium]|jgi:quercetin dioxygenase-like cupin family protein|nr:cupin domain-containing protein [Bryobacteraceae bacterium]